MNKDSDESGMQALPRLAAEVAELQTLVAFQEQTIAELNDVLSQQHRMLGAIQREWAAMKSLYQSLQEKNLNELQQGNVGDISDTAEKPPHY
ncbi:MAG: SlyX family protein [Halieaceae bacterium]|jgi:uncharacterized coiled-coil protein SlyX|nr:SlyX family protein [Halieaceae bacterium]